jgi:hypothetical protein
LFGFDKFKWLLRNAIEYSKLGINSESPRSIIEHSIALLELAWFNKENFVLITISIIGFIIIMLKLRNNKKELLINLLLMFLFLTSIFVVIFLPKNSLFHYTIFLWIPNFIFCGYLFFRIELINKPKFQIFFLLLMFISKIYDGNWRLFYPISELRAKDYLDLDDPINKFLYLNTKPNDGIIVWGWGNRYFIPFMLQRSSCFLYPQFATGQYSGKQKAIDVYVEDINKYKPKVIIELVGPKQFYFNNKEKYSIENNSASLMKFINSNYDCVETDSNYVLYKLKKTTYIIRP